jgi:hypothetical protein
VDTGKCIAVCPTGGLAKGPKGYRVQPEGLPGRHPRLAKELPGVYNEKQVRKTVKDCIGF